MTLVCCVHVKCIVGSSEQKDPKIAWIEAREQFVRSRVRAVIAHRSQCCEPMHTRPHRQHAHDI